MKTTTRKLPLLVSALALLAGCAYVEETAEGRAVRVVSAADVGNCTSLGKTRVSVPKVGRGEQFVRDDLIRLAKNSAAKTGADTIVAAGEPVNEEQVFDMYRCVKP